MENMNLALTLLIAGFVIVFIVLILLIVIITLYGKIIQSVQKSSQNRKERKRQVQKAAQIETKQENAVQSAASADPQNDGIPDEIIAVIAAAVDAVYGEKPHKIRSVRRSRSTRSAWGSAGIIQNTSTF